MNFRNKARASWLSTNLLAIQDRAGSPMDYEHLIEGIFVFDHMMLSIGTIDIFEIYTEIRLRLELGLLLRLFLCTHQGNISASHVCSNVFYDENYCRTVTIFILLISGI
jgi:hypothetical protein